MLDYQGKVFTGRLVRKSDTFSSSLRGPATTSAVKNEFLDDGANSVAGQLSLGNV